MRCGGARSTRRKLRHMARDKLIVQRSHEHPRPLCNALPAWPLHLPAPARLRINGILLFVFNIVPTSDLHSSCTGHANDTLGVSTVQWCSRHWRCALLCIRLRMTRFVLLCWIPGAAPAPSWCQVHRSHVCSVSTLFRSRTHVR